ncbi:MAG: toxin HicA [Gemmatimonadetes bacterium]|nr:toxin HicA [Gemmatimonadota bacterium]MYC00128.1 toxin HicA [Gemmatimonadota bacterium]MYI45334.1 toxin HicA [Gemmatimonadota bacterium]
MKRRKLLAALDEFRRNPAGVRFRDLVRVCDACFGEPRRRSGGHRVYRTPWPGDPRVNIQNAKGMAKAYQVRQVIQAVERLEDMQ